MTRRVSLVASVPDPGLFAELALAGPPVGAHWIPHRDHDGGGPMQDETMPSGGGVIRRLGAAGAGFAGVFAAVEIGFAPNAAQSRQQRAEQRQVMRAPAPSDPPNLDPEALAAAGIRVLVYRWTQPPASPPAGPPPG